MKAKAQKEKERPRETSIQATGWYRECWLGFFCGVQILEVGLCLVALNSLSVPLRADRDLGSNQTDGLAKVELFPIFTCHPEILIRINNQNY